MSKQQIHRKHVRSSTLTEDDFKYLIEFGENYAVTTIKTGRDTLMIDDQPYKLGKVFGWIKSRLLSGFSLVLDKP